MTSSPKIVCICPTYKRPEMLRNSLACFLRQTYDNKHLIIVDDAHQFDNQVGQGWQLLSTPYRYESLPVKFNAMIDIARGLEPDIIAVWEDDDIYLPQHLFNIAAMYEGEGWQFFAPREAFSTYQQPFGGTQREGADGRFHASWAYTIELLDRLKGYPITERLDFDQQMHRRCATACHAVCRYDQFKKVGPSYVYRWGNPTYHGSQFGEEGYRRLWDELATRPAPKIGKLTPHMDDETKLIYIDHDPEAK